MSELMRNGSTCLLVLMIAPVLLADDDHKKHKSSELQVPPLEHITYPDDRPQWVGGSHVEGLGQDATVVVVSGPCETLDESREDLELMTRAAVSTFVSTLTDDGRFDFYDPTPQEIQDDLVLRRYEGEVTKGGVTHYEHAVELHFDQEKRSEIKHAWKQLEIRDRLGALGVIGLFGTVLLICSSTLIGTFSRRVERREEVAG